MVKRGLPVTKGLDGLTVVGRKTKNQGHNNLWHPQPYNSTWVACSRPSDNSDDAWMKDRRKYECVILALSLPSFLPFCFRVHVFSISRTRLSRILERASACTSLWWVVGTGPFAPLSCLKFLYDEPEYQDFKRKSEKQVSRMFIPVIKVTS